MSSTSSVRAADRGAWAVRRRTGLGRFALAPGRAMTAPCANAGAVGPPLHRSLPGQRRLGLDRARQGD